MAKGLSCSASALARAHEVHVLPLDPDASVCVCVDAGEDDTAREDRTPVQHGDAAGMQASVVAGGWGEAGVVGDRDGDPALALIDLEFVLLGAGGSGGGVSTSL